ncbi:unnamed protein product [Parnassius apollo]|uniref:(apollo) hypothetical protein n=1 Tax=Parnassius apollo TaxID=110799 RepID=A0A8S3XJS4_PARAO|nr:unnamed protein product [Parnassius apollo]
MSEPEGKKVTNTVNINSAIKPSDKKVQIRGRKRKRLDSSSSSDPESMLPENTLVMEKNLHASAIKNNLDDASVKKILKKVVTNDHVLALVKLREEEEESSSEEKVRPKLTRAKVKELMKVSPKSAPWNLENLELTPIKHIPIKTRPEVKALIAQELPEDEDDDEYQPTHDDVQSDDDQTLESVSDIESQPRTPATPNVFSPRVEKDGPFKVPQNMTTPSRRKLNLDEEATIALRTRSKLSLSETPIEHIESSFVPPDDVPTVDVDDPVWNEFLEECLNPASTSFAKNEDDDDADPEYNVAADPDANDDDEEALENNIIKISKKELSDLVTELFSIMPEVTTQDELAENLTNDVFTENNDIENNIWKGKKEPLSDEEMLIIEETTTVERRKSITYLSVGKSEPSDDQTNTEEENRKEPGQDESKTTTTNTTTIQSTTTPVTTTIPTTTPATRTTNTIKKTGTVYVEEETRIAQPEEPPQPPQVLQTCQVELQQEHTPVVVQLDSNAPCILPEQILILQQQLRQHIQLSASNFLQVFVHPVHWSYGPQYKEYLETFNKLVTKNPDSVANVCNLKPAIELIASWEKTVAETTPQNTAMVKFIQEQIERSRSRCAQNSLYVGEFHDTLKDVVANSPVFLYPYLLPAMPYRADVVRRFKFLRSEDALIALGLDEFWEYVEMNPQLFRCRTNVNARCGLKATVKLLCRYLMPWCTPHSLLGHLHYVRRTDKDNPIHKFFATRKVEPVVHKLLPFNPKLTLYEQPEYEMPRIWIRHLAKTSKRFKSFLHRRTNMTGMSLNGVNIDLGTKIQYAVKKPLPIDFTKQISNEPTYLLPKIAPKPPVPDKIDVYIDKSSVNTTAQSGVANGNIMRIIIANDKAYLIPVSQTTTVNSVSEPICSAVENNSLANSIANVDSQNPKDDSANVNTVPGNANVDITNMRTNESITEKEKSDNVQNVAAGNASNSKNMANDPNHCMCCIVMRKICRQRQTTITEFFKPDSNKVNVACACRSLRRPKVTNKLRLLLKYYKSRSMYVHKDTKYELAQCGENDLEYANVPEVEVTELEDLSDPKDIEFVTLFELRLLLRLGLVRNRYIKQKIYILLSNFDHESDDPVLLANSLEKICDVELVDIFKEFLRFLTPEQAEKIDKFRDYFTQECAPNLLKRIKDVVTDKSKRHALLSRLITAFTDNKSTACMTCSDLLRLMDGYPELAQYTFSLFPHKRPRQIVRPTVSRSLNVESSSTIESSVQNNVTRDEEDELRICDESQTGMDYEDDHSSSTGDVSDTEENQLNENENSDHNNANKDSDRIIKEERDNAENYKGDQNMDSPIEEQSQPEKSANDLDTNEYSDDSDIKLELEIISDDEGTVKIENPEWQRCEDKLILEIVKNSLTREERKNKTVKDILEEKEVLKTITESLSHKSAKEVTERVMYLLELLVISENV